MLRAGARAGHEKFLIIFEKVLDKQGKVWYNILVRKRKNEVIKMYKHIAYNLYTGEVLMCNTGNQLKRWVKRTNAWAIRNGYKCGQWVFSHDGDPSHKIW